MNSPTIKIFVIPNCNAQSMLVTAQQNVAATAFAGSQSIANNDSRFDSDSTIPLDDNLDPKSNGKIYLPTALKVANDTVEMYGVDGCLTTEECQHLIMLIRENRQRSTTTDEGVSQFRTSSTCALDTLNDRIVEDIDRRICQYMGIDPM